MDLTSCSLLMVEASDDGGSQLPFPFDGICRSRCFVLSFHSVEFVLIITLQQLLCSKMSNPQHLSPMAALNIPRAAMQPCMLVL
jgi:hypothetical protein